MSTVHTALGEGRIVESERRLGGSTWHRVSGVGYDKWFAAHEITASDSGPEFYDNQQVSDAPSAEGRREFERHLEHWEQPHGIHVQASEQDGWQPTPDDEQADLYGQPLDAAPLDPMLDEMGPEGGPSGPMGEDPDFANELAGLSEFAATGEVSPAMTQEFSGSPDLDSILGAHRYAGPGDDVDHSNSVTLPYNPTPQHDAVGVIPDGSWAPGDGTDGGGVIDADARLHPADSLSFDEKTDSEAGPYPGPAPHLFAATGQQCEYCGAHGHSWQAHPEAHADVADWEREHAREEEPFGHHVEAGMSEWLHEHLGDDEEDPYQVSDAREWMRHHQPTYGPLESDDATIQDREERYRQHTIPGLDRAASLQDRAAALRLSLGSKYVTPMLYAAVDHFNDPVQMFRDDPHGYIERSASITHDPDLDREAALLDAEAQRLGGWDKTAAWKDVSRKATRLRREGRVHVKDIGPDRIYASVDGDHGTYETMITKGSALGGYDAYYSEGGQSVGNWRCSCKWGEWAHQRRFTFIGRLCSHGLASYWTMQADHQNPDSPRGYSDPRRTTVKTKRAFNSEERPQHRDRGLDYLLDHYGPHDRFDPTNDFAERTHDAQDYAARSDLPGDADDVPLGVGGLLMAFRKGAPFAGYEDFDACTSENSDKESPGGYCGEIQRRVEKDKTEDKTSSFDRLAKEFLRTTPRGLTPDLHFIDKERNRRREDVTSLGEQDMPGAAEEGSEPTDAEIEGKTAMRLGYRIVGWIVDEVLPDFEEWYAKNHGSELSDAMPTEAMSAAADYSQVVGLDQATTEMLQEWVGKNFAPEGAKDPDAQNADEDIKHFAMAAGRYLLASMRQGAPNPNPLDVFAPVPAGATTAPAPSALDQMLPGIAGAPIPAAGPPSLPANSPFNPGGVYSAPAGGAPAAGGGGVQGPGIGPNDRGGAPTAPSAPSAPVNQSAGGGANSIDYKSTYPAGGAGGGDSYTVKPGDTLSDIAQAHGMGGDWQSLYDTNKSTVGANPDLITPGETLNLPGAQHGTSGGAAPGPTATDNGPHGAPGSATNPTDATPGPSVNPSAGDTPKTSTDKEGRRNVIVASDEALLNHLRDLAAQPSAGAHVGDMATHTNDVRSTVNELRDRGYGANQLVAMVRSAADDQIDNYNWDDDPKNPKNNGVARGTPHNPAPVAPMGANTPGGAGGSGTPVNFPTPEGSSAKAPSATPASAPSSSAGADTGAGNGNVPPRPTGVSADQALGGTGEDLSAGGGGPHAAPKQDAKEPGGGDGGGVGGDFMNALGQFAPMIGDIGSGIGSALSGLGGGGGLAGMIPEALGGLTHLFGSTQHSAAEDEFDMLLGEQPPEGTRSPSGYAGSGPDHQSWATSSQDYVDAHEQGNRTDVTDLGDGDITKYSFDDMMREASAPGFADLVRQANAFDDYGDWGYAKTESANPADWGSVDSFFSDAKDAQGNLGDTDPARQVIEDHLDHYSAFGMTANQNRFGKRGVEAIGRSGYQAGPGDFISAYGMGRPDPSAAPAHYGNYTPVGLGFEHLAAEQGYFGVGAGPAVPTPDGLAHSDGAANLHNVVKPHHQHPPTPPRLPGMPPQHPGQLPQQPLAQPRSPGVGGGWSQGPPTQFGPPQAKQGGIQRQAVQVGAGGLAPVFSTGVPTPQAPAPGHYGGYEQFIPEPQVPLRQTAGLSLVPHQVAHDQSAAFAACDRTPHLGQYQRTSDSSEVVRQFQAQMGGGDWHTGYTPTGVGGVDISGGANAFLARQAGRNYSLAQQAELEQEAHVLGARNLDDLDLSGTHYLES